eukprot:1074383-Prymnesium_polylepis.1
MVAADATVRAAHTAARWPRGTACAAPRPLPRTDWPSEGQIAFRDAVPRRWCMIVSLGRA